MKFFQKIKMVFKMLALAKKVNKLLKIEQYDEALKICEDAQKEHPRLSSHIDSLILSIHEQSGDTKKVKEFEEKIENDFNKQFEGVDAYEHLENAQKLLEEEEYEEAIKEALSGIKLKPSAILYSTLAEAYAENDQDDEAIEAFKKAIEMKPSGWLYCELSDIYIEQEKYDEAVELLKEGYEKLKEGYIYYLLGKIYYEEINDTTIAIETLKKGIEIEPDDDYCYGLLQKIYFELENYKGSIRYGLQAIKYDDEASIYYSYLGVAYTRLEEFEKALPHSLKAIKLNDEGSVYHDELADVYEGLQEYKKAIKHQEKAIEIYQEDNDEENESYLLALASLYTLNKQFSAALKIYEDLLEDDYDENYYHKMIRIYEELGDQESIQKCQTIIEEHDKKQEQERKQRLEEQRKEIIEQCTELSKQLIERDKISKDDCFDISVLLAQDVVYEENAINRLGGFGIGIDEESWPKYEDEYMDHIITLDLQSFPALQVQYPEYRAVSLYISDAFDNEAYEVDTDETTVLFLTQENIDHRKLSQDIDEPQLEKNSFVFETIVIPKKIFEYEYDEEDELIEQLSGLLYNASYFNGCPLWMQNEDREDEGFIGQIDERLVEINIGGDGIMYIFNDRAFWQCG